MGTEIVGPDIKGEKSGYYSKVGYDFVMGEQLGWFAIRPWWYTIDEFIPSRAYLRELALCRIATIDFLVYGQFLRPINLVIHPNPLVKWDSGQLPALFSAVW